MARTQRTVQDKVVAITGGARGIGYATAKRLIAEGARVAIGDVDDIRLKAAATELGITTYAHLDVTDSGDFERFLDHVESELGPVDVVINNAGIMPLGAFADESDRNTRRTLDINVLGVIVGTKLALTRMLPRRSGHIINIASIAGESYVPGGATYCASKHAVAGFTESVRREYRGSGVAISQVRPTFTNTELLSGSPGAKGMRNAQPEEIAQAIVGLIRRPRPVVRITKLAGAVAASQALVPLAVGERLARLFGVESTFSTGVDTAARAAYEERVRST